MKKQPRATFICDNCKKECESYERIETEKWEMWGVVTTTHDPILLSACCNDFVVTRLNLD